MITLFDVFSKKKNNDGFKIGDYVKINNTLYSFLPDNDEIFRIDRMDNIEAYLKTIDDNYPESVILASVLRKNLRKLTGSEEIELKLKLDLKKYNL